MAFKKRKVDLDKDPLASEFAPPPLPKLTEREIQDFAEWLQPFYEEKEVRKWGGGKGTETVRVLNTDEAMVAYGAKRKRMHLGVLVYSVVLKPTEFDSYGNPTQYQTPTMLDYFENKYEQFLASKGKKDFSERMRLEELDKVAETMTVADDYGLVPEA